MPRKFSEWRSEAEKLNQIASAQGQPEPIPDYAQLRLRPLARKVLQVRFDVGQRGTINEH